MELRSGMGRARGLFSDLKLVLALRALERADPAGEFLPSAERRAWSREAGLDGLPEKPGAARMVRKLAERARVANGKRLAWSVRPLLLGLASCDLPAFVVAVVAAGAFLLGGASLQLGEHRAVNLLGLPLVALLAWNALVYVWLIVSALWRVWRKPKTGQLARGVTEWWGARRALGRLQRERDDGSGAWREAMVYGRRALEIWRDSFVAVAGPILRSRIGMMFHLAAFLWAAGAVTGLYYQGWSRSFHAYWESTLLDAPEVRTFFSVLFTPASQVTGVAVPLDDIPALEGISEAAESTGASARPWFHLYAATLALFIGVPRLALAVWYSLGGRVRLARAVRAPLLGKYFDEVRHGAVEGPPSRSWIVVTEDPAGVPASTTAELERWGVARELFNEIELREIPPDPTPEQRRAVLAGADALLHGAEKTPDDGVREELAVLRETAGDTGAAKLVFLDARRFLERFSALPAAEDRWRERQAAWREAVGGDPLGLVIINETVPLALPPREGSATPAGPAPSP
ncbi:MAG: hypothetical protein ACREIA_15855 [Opitutaceae bacterium]